MSTVLNLNESWEAYNNRKRQIGQDPKCFSPEELWEFNYLVDLIQAAKPHLEQITVILAVREGMRRTMAPRLREHFVELVVENIKERENQWVLLMESMGQGVNITPTAVQYPFIPN
jgi:hypothetical protein